MSQKHDDFFKSSSPHELTGKILKAAQSELAQNKQRQKSKFWFLIVGPVLAAVTASVFVFQMNIMQNPDSAPQAVAGLAAVQDVSEEVLNSAEHIELVSDMMQDSETAEMVDELGFLQELEHLENLSEADLEG